jgi:glycosyltransferase involved in cell wall biosynthesis
MQINKHPLVSVITPSFNKGSYIEETIQSILNQSYHNVEYIVMDGGSTDETLSILKKYNDQIIWKSEPDSGQSDAINKGWKTAKGEILAYLNADDIYYPMTIETVVNYFNNHPEIKIVYGDGILTNESGRIIGTHKAGPYCYNELLYGRNFILQPTVFFRSEVLTRIGYIDISLHLAMDLDYWIRAGYHYRFGYIQKPALAGAKIYAGTKTITLLSKTVDELEYIIEKIYTQSDVGILTLPPKKEVLNYIYCKGGLDCIHLKKLVRGLYFLNRAFFLNPLLCIKNVMQLLIKFIKDRRHWS